jgi:protein-S-isoprenylcysteine O-methyltransferase Ste14
MQERPSGGPDVIALPPLILGAAIALGLSLNFFWPVRVLAHAVAVPLGILLTLAAIAIGVLAVREMFAASLLAAVLQKGVIEPEEAYLERNFGEDYLRYKARVRHWI